MVGEWFVKVGGELYEIIMKMRMIRIWIGVRGSVGCR